MPVKSLISPAIFFGICQGRYHKDSGPFSCALGQFRSCWFLVRCDCKRLPADSQCCQPSWNSSSAPSCEFEELAASEPATFGTTLLQWSPTQVCLIGWPWPGLGIRLRRFWLSTTTFTMESSKWLRCGWCSEVSGPLLISTRYLQTFHRDSIGLTCFIWWSNGQEQ